MASQEEITKEQMRVFSTGATRNADTEREDPEGFLAPSVLESYIAYMHKNRFQKDGKVREADNWQLGIPQRAYVKSLWRHFFGFWKRHREMGNHVVGTTGYRNDQLIEDCNAMIFNCMGYMFEELKKPPLPSPSKLASLLNMGIQQDPGDEDDGKDAWAV